MRRHALGVIAISFLALAAFLAMRPNHDDLAFAMSVCLRVGLLLSALWLALPQLEQISKHIPPWLAACIGFGGLLIAVRPRLILYIGPALGAIAMLQGVGWLFKPLPQNGHRNYRAGAQKKQEGGPVRDETVEGQNSRR